MQASSSGHLKGQSPRRPIVVSSVLLENIKCKGWLTNSKIYELLKNTYFQFEIFNFKRKPQNNKKLSHM